MFATPIDTSLTAVELQLGVVSAAVTTGEPTGLTAACTTFRQAAVDLSVLLQGPQAINLKSPHLKARIKKIAAELGMQRESLMRRTALVEMTLNAVLPVPPRATYGQTTGPFASVGRSSRVIKYLAA